VYSYLWNVIVNGLPAPIYGATNFQEVAFVFNNIEGIGYAANPFRNQPQSIPSVGGPDEQGVSSLHARHQPQLETCYYRVAEI
jgi:hypothetical protein